MKQNLLKRPTNKVAVGALAGAVMAIVAWAARQFGQVEVPAEIAMAGTTVITFGVQYLMPDAAIEDTEAVGQPDPLLSDTQPLDRP